MNGNQISKAGIQFLAPTVLCEMVRRIETSCPGWWWSMSQRPSEISITMGPGRNCPHQPDNEYALTREGDSGRSCEITGVGPNADVTEKYILDSLDGFLTSFNEDRKFTGLKTRPSLGGRLDTSYRQQTPSDLLALERAYIVLLGDVKPIEERGHRLLQVYFGSCDLSADCSLRGKRVNDSEFDISFDLQDDGTIAESLSWAIGELKSDVLTPRQS